MPSARSRQKIAPRHDESETRVNYCKKLDAALAVIKYDESTSQIPTPTPPQPPQNWPITIPYLACPTVSPYLTVNQKRWLYYKPATYLYSSPPTTDLNHAEVDKDAIPIIRLHVPDNPSRIEIKVIDDKNHPAHGQRGLLAVCDLKPGEFVVPYVGYLHSSTASERAEADQQLSATSSAGSELRQQRFGSSFEVLADSHDELFTGSNAGESGRAVVAPTQPIGSWDSSDYDLNLVRDEDFELAIDAAQMGNEARFCNDYRGVPAFVDPTAHVRDEWERRKKRTAQTRREEIAFEDGDGEEKKREGRDTAMAIPNAEFRDVWFEWAAEDEDGRTKTAGGRSVPTTINDIEQAVAQASINSKDDVLSKPKNPAQVNQKRNGGLPRKRRAKTGMRGVAVFVLPVGRSGKRKNGIKAGQEVLVSYGKGFWAHHGT